MFEFFMGSYDMESEARGRSREVNEMLREQQIADGGQHSILDRIIDEQCRNEAYGRSLRHNVDICERRDVHHRPVRIIKEVIYEQIRRLFS